jgi:hypothetical protein
MKPSWKEIEKSLNDRQARPQTRDADSFWPDFKARARMRTQDSPSRARAPLIWRWSVATACATLIAAFVGFQFLDRPLVEKESPVKSLDVLAAHSAVFMISDEPTDATVVWVADMSIESVNEE